MKLTCGIVLYNPQISNLVKNINELNKNESINNIILVDNGSKNIYEIENNISFIKKVKLIKNKENKGIASALNQILKYAHDNKQDLLLTLDQDSFISKDALDKMLKYVDYENVAIICPVINDLNKNLKIEKKDSFEYIDRCITSGSLMILKNCNQIGMFDDKMFIDYVDFDYCKRIIINTKKILRVKNAILVHEIGKRSKRKFFWKTVFPTNHNEFRIYYYSRNIKYYLRKHRKNMTIKEKLIEHKYLLWKFVSIILYENNKAKKLKAYYKGYFSKGE